MIIFLQVLTVTLVLLLGASLFRLIRERRALLRDLYSAPQAGPGRVSQEPSWPEPVARYLAWAGALEGPDIRRARIVQRGEFRTEAKKRWMGFRAEQHVTADPFGFVWLAAIGGLIRVSDSFIQGRGRMRAGLLGLMTVVDSQGPDLDRGELIRFLSEAPWYPTVLADSRIAWEGLDNYSAKASLSLGPEMAVEGIFHFSGDGPVMHFSAERPMDTKNGFVNTPWSAYYYDFRKTGRFMIPRQGRAVWHEKDGDLEYVRLEIKDATFTNREDKTKE
ncbi:MAG: DUF6544 family protein [Thermodesulfobacteriota bacterium]